MANGGNSSRNRSYKICVSLRLYPEALIFSSVAYCSNNLLAFVNKSSCFADRLRSCSSSLFNAASSCRSRVVSLDCSRKSTCNRSLIDFNVGVMSGGPVSIYVVDDTVEVPGEKIQKADAG